MNTFNSATAQHKQILSSDSSEDTIALKALPDSILPVRSARRSRMCSAHPALLAPRLGPVRLTITPMNPSSPNRALS